MGFLLDTNIVSDLVRHPHGRIFQRIADNRNAMICTSIVVAAELRFGVVRRKTARLASQLETVLDSLNVMPLEAPAEVHYAEIRARLEAARTPIGANDMFIAAHALALGCTLVTDNLSEFSRVKGLAVENWLR